MGQELEETIKNHEPRVQLLNINVDMVTNNNSYEVNVVYRIVNTQAVDSIKVQLERL
jgi:hypothetical protein